MQHIEETILSVLNQSYDNVEYLIIDGGSSDGTCNLIAKYEHAVDYWISTSDDGIFHAMNKGIDLANGNWINFMNSGDQFYDRTTIKNIVSAYSINNVQILYGHHGVLYPSGQKRIIKAGPLENLWRGSQFCHQSSFVDSSYLKKNKFKLSAKNAADFQFFYEAKVNNVKFMKVNEVVAQFRSGGVSDIDRINVILSWWSVIDKSIIKNFFYFYLIIKETLKKLPIISIILNKFR